ncbi:Glutathione-dependent formaldehyde-activating enzyme [Pseudooceanicola marinus]|uniref:Glutathione-dependent formaldehyde-activating enzyme n=1 Tax=Pseudooceanicola marinus TaxID=396013 RepID=A0A1X6Y9T0_9RHOB|nr:GFA family protein [Pseudooceanicola marinus]SLN15125.1 Glutathione-dependent formaldehyde-activating enzyme [Pseudooceanicola marinus]
MSSSRSDASTPKPGGALALPDLPLTGGCQCGAVRYRVTGAPVTFYLCHCSRCQRQSGSAFGESLQLRPEDLQIEGELQARAVTGGSGRAGEIRFCPACGTRITHRVEGSPVVVLKPGTLDAPGWLRPVAELFIEERQPWLPALPGVAQYEGAPPMPELHAAFARMLAEGAA